MGRVETHSGERGQARRAGEKGRAATPVNPVQVQKFLGGLDYPARKQQIIEKARAGGADKNVLASLERLPDREYDGPAGISREIGKMK